LDGATATACALERWPGRAINPRVCAGGLWQDHPGRPVVGGLRATLGLGFTRYGRQRSDLFLQKLVAAVRTCRSGACPTLQSLINADPLPDVADLAYALTRDLGARTDRLVLVFDDYHLIRLSEVHTLICHLLGSRLPGLHLVILADFTPPLPLAGWRSAGQMNQICTVDLRLSLEETRRFLRGRAGRLLDDDALEFLHACTEGWILALQLARSMLESQDLWQVLACFGDSERAVVDISSRSNTKQVVRGPA
jgi:ATP/maltotriose-dependent transcriptional regulator MalT